MTSFPVTSVRRGTHLSAVPFALRVLPTSVLLSYKLDEEDDKLLRRTQIMARQGKFTINYFEPPKLRESARLGMALDALAIRDGMERVYHARVLFDAAVRRQSLRYQCPRRFELGFVYELAIGKTFTGTEENEILYGNEPDPDAMSLVGYVSMDTRIMMGGPEEADRIVCECFDHILQQYPGSMRAPV